MSMKSNRTTRPSYGKAMEQRMGIHIKPSHKGELHKDLKVPQGQKIPASKLEAAKNSKSPAVRKRATFALNAKKWG